MNSNYYKPPERKNWPNVRSGSYISRAVHHLDITKDIDIPKDSTLKIGLIGYAYDEGVRLNHGNPGSAQGPEKFRQAFGRKAWHHANQIVLYDLGDVVFPETGNIQQAHKTYASVVEKALKNGIFPLGIGGGHDISRAQFLGVQNYLDQKHGSPKWTIAHINCPDPHFDLREAADGIITSGTPYADINSILKQRGQEFHYHVFGMQAMRSTPESFADAQRLGAKYTLLEDFTVENAKRTSQVLGRLFQKAQYFDLSTDLDGFKVSGVSNRGAFGADPDVVLHTFKLLFDMHKFKLCFNKNWPNILKTGPQVVAYNIAELCPPRDSNIDPQTGYGDTTEFAASLAHQFIDIMAQARGPALDHLSNAPNIL